MNKHNNKKEIFSVLSNQIFIGDINLDRFTEVKISSFKNTKIADELKTLQVIELDDPESFLSYVNYDHYLMFKCDDDHYFCNTELVPSFGKYSLIKLIDFNQYLRKDKIKRINNENTIN